MSRAPVGPVDGTDGIIATYLYCIVQSAAAPSLDDLPEGLPETSAPRLLPLGGDLWLVVGEAPLPAFSAAEIERRLSDLAWVSACAVAHERVVAHFAALAPVVPMKLFTLFQNDARAVAELASRREQIAAVLARVAGAAEWGVRVHFDAARAARELREASGKAASAAPASGRGFLLRKKEAQEAARDLARRAGAAADEACLELAGQAAAVRRREPEPPAEPGPRLILDAAFLVPAERAEAFERAVQAVAERLAGSACALTLTGPWPPYNFIEEVGWAPRIPPSSEREEGTALDLLEGADGSLLEVVDHLLNQGVVVTGDVVLGLAGVDLIFLRLSAVLCAADRLLGQTNPPITPSPPE